MAIAEPGNQSTMAKGQTVRLRLGFEHLIRAWPIRWRILLITVVNMAVVLVLAGLVWIGANILGEAWSDLTRVRQSDWALVSLETEASRLQSLLQRYFSRPDPKTLDE